MWAEIRKVRAEIRKVRADLRARSAPATARNPALDRLRLDPTYPFRALGLTPDPWQRDFLESAARRESLLCCRQAGKSLVTAARVIREACLTPRSDCLVFSPTLRQSMELARKVAVFLKAMDCPVPVAHASRSAIELANGSRVISLPDNQEGVVGFSAPRLIVIDEGSRVSDELYASVRPMLATGSGALLTLSTPFGRAGWFYRIWDDTADGALRRTRLKEKWRKTAVPATRVPRISAEFLNDELIELGRRWYEQEYLLRFLDAVDAVFAQEVIHKARADGIQPLF